MGSSLTCMVLAYSCSICTPSFLGLTLSAYGYLCFSFLSPQFPCLLQHLHIPQDFNSAICYISFLYYAPTCRTKWPRAFQNQQWVIEIIIFFVLHFVSGTTEPPVCFPLSSIHSTCLFRVTRTVVMVAYRWQLTLFLGLHTILMSIDFIDGCKYPVKWTGIK